MIAVGPMGERSAVLKAWPFGRATAAPAVARWQTGGVWTADYSASYELLYRTQPWVYICVNKLSRAIARLPLHAFTLDLDTGDREREREGTLPELLHRPYRGGSSVQLKEHLIASCAVYGNALLRKGRPGPGTEPDELWRLDWRRVTVYGQTTDAMSPVDHYAYSTDYGPPELLAPEDVVHVQWWGPEGLGVSPLEPLRHALANEAAASAYSTSSFTNGVRPSGALVTPKNLRPEQRSEIRQEIESANAGAERAGRMLLLDGGLDWKVFGGSAADAQMTEVRRLNRDEVCAAYDIPPPMVGILDRATFSNIDEQHRMLYQDTLGPWLVLIEQAFGAQLVEPEPAWDGLFVEFLLDDVLRGDIEKRSQAYQRMLQGVYTPNELRRAENQPMIEHPLADSIWLPLNMQPVSDEELEAAAGLDEARRLELVRALVGAHTNGH